MARQYPPWTGSATADAAGNATITYQPRGSTLQRVTQVAAEMTGGGTGRGTIRRNGAIITPFVPTGGAAGGDPPIWLWPGDILTIEWVGVSPGLVGKATVIYDLGPE